MLKEPRYARDVLLVCESHPGSDLDSLARHFRVASVEPVDDHGLPSGFGAESTGFGLSRPAGDADLPAQRPARNWFSLAR
jgi:hypothetical protein